MNEFQILGRHFALHVGGTVRSFVLGGKLLLLLLIGLLFEDLVVLAHHFGVQPAAGVHRVILNFDCEFNI